MINRPLEDFPSREVSPNEDLPLYDVGTVEADAYLRLFRGEVETREGRND